MTQLISKQLKRWCEEAHSAFLTAHNLDYWHLTVVGLPLPVVVVSSETPGGDMLEPKEIEVTLNFRSDLRFLLESHYRKQHNPIREPPD